MREAENKKRQLEEAADALREECARLQVHTLLLITDSIFDCYATVLRRVVECEFWAVQLCTALFYNK